ncbi:ATP-binding protein [Paenibacillus sanguinis]|uniref:ATP-binding protein n=1 Tax=Paenibacillus sanguinis TaxID=225906 RepID=UPI0003819A13|nr:ATP-binding protein [Paenibacillus sanguinis]
MEAIDQYLPGLLQRVEALRAQGATQTPKKPSVEDSPVFDCPLCQDEGIVFYPEQNLAVECKCQERKRVQRMLKSSNISEEFVQKTFDTFDVQSVDRRVAEVYKLVKEYSDTLAARVKKGQGLQGVPWLGILGKSGSGKTHLSTAAVVPLVELGVQPVFFNWVSGFTEWMAYYNIPDEAYKVDEIRKRLYNCEILIVDDVCKESQKDTWVKEFYGIVDFRYRKGLPIIYTSEYFEDLIGFLSEATAGRLFEKSRSAKTEKKYIGQMFLGSDEDPLLLNFRFKDLV